MLQLLQITLGFAGYPLLLERHRGKILSVLQNVEWLLTE